MPATAENERDNAGWAYQQVVPRERAPLAVRLGLRPARQIAAPAPGDGAMAAVPLAPYDVTAERPLVGPLMPLATGNVQLGKYATPYGAPTQVHALVSGPQLRCGVETVRRQYLTPGSPASPAPFFQQTMRPSFPVMTTKDGNRPGNTLGAAGVAQAYGTTRAARESSLQSFTSSLLGW